MTNTKLKALKVRKDKAWATFKALNDKLDELCHCPEKFMVTEEGYETDTLGNNGTTRYYDSCEVCGKQGETYGGVYSGGYGAGANYRKKNDKRN
jgi:hypothetical protein